MVQWLRIHLPVHGTQVWALVREDPTCLGATKPMHHNYWACTLEPESHNYWAHITQLLKPVSLEPMLRSKRSHRSEKPAHQASLVVQWLGVCPSKQGTRARALVWEDPTCHGATRPACYNCWACALEPTSHNYWARVPQLLKPVHLEPMLHSKRSHRNEE